MTKNSSIKEHDKNLRIVWFSCSGAPFGAEILEHLRSLEPAILDEILLVVLSKSKLKVSAKKADKQIKGYTGGIRKALQWRVNNSLFKLGTLYRRLIAKIRRQPFKRIEDFCLQYNKNIHLTRDINNDNTAEIISGVKPDLIIMATFHHILKPSVFCIPRIGTVNVHPSYLPDYKGPDPINAVIKDKVNETGVTLHKVDEGIDTGEIISQRKVSLTGRVNEKRLRGMLASLAAELLSEYVQQLRER
jgi:folate-dependent phosphoribosylglycinamide formyltransferase PurN